jgi:hypothetical protein
VTGNTINKVTIYSRNAAETKVTLDTFGNTVANNFEHNLSKSTQLIGSYTNFEITSSTTNTGGSDKYQLIYVPWGRETYLHLIVLNDQSSATTGSGNTPVLKYTFGYDDAGRIIQALNPGSSPTADPIVGNLVVYTNPTFLANAYSTSADLYKSSDSQFLRLNYYDTTNLKYQLCYRAIYNPVNGEVIVPSTAGTTTPDSVRLYKRIVNEKRDASGVLYTKETTSNSYKTDAGVDMPSASTSIENATNGAGLNGFASRIINPGIGGGDDYYSIIYTSIGKRTLLVVLKLNNSITASTSNASANSSTKYEIYKVYRFDDKGVFTDGTTAGTSDSGSVGGGGSSDTAPPSTPDALNDWLLKYLLNSGGGSAFDYNTINDYMLKTQIVPPVCPTCPACPNGGGACNNCGGKGGSGTYTGSKKGYKKNSYTDDNDDDEDGNILRDTGRGATNLLRDTGSGATNLLRDGASGTAGLAKDTVSGTVGLAKDTVSGTVGLAKDTVSGTVGLVKDTAGGVANSLGKLVPTKVTNANYDGDTPASAGGGPSSNVTTGSDYTSYFGALPSKGGNYIPITADFSKFGK